jgi:hypothetical protein
MSYTLTHNHLAGVRYNRESRIGETVEFRLYDDDGELYYSGFATDDNAVLDALDRYQDIVGVTQAMVLHSDEIGTQWLPLN